MVKTCIGEHKGGKMNTVPIDHCKFIRCPECHGYGTKNAIDLNERDEFMHTYIWDYCELCGGMGEYLEIDYVEVWV